MSYQFTNLLDPDLRFVEAGAPAFRTFPRLGELPFTEREAALPAFRWLEHHLMPGSPCGANRVAQVILDVGRGRGPISRAIDDTDRGCAVSIFTRSRRRVTSKTDDGTQSPLSSQRFVVNKSLETLRALRALRSYCVRLIGRPSRR